MRRSILKENSSLFHSFLYLFDWMTIAASSVLSYRIYLRTWEIPSSYALVIGISILLSASIFPRFDLYRPWRAGMIPDELRAMTLSWILVLILLLSFLFVTKMGAFYSRGWMGTWMFVGLLSLILERVGLRIALRFVRSQGWNQRNIAVVGMSGFMGSLEEKISKMPWAGFKIVGFFPLDPIEKSILPFHAPVLGGWKDVSSFVQQGGVDQVWIVMPLKEEDRLKTLLYDLRHSTVDIRFFPDLFEVRLLNHSISEIAGFPVINLSVSPMEGMNRFVKAIEDKLLASLFLFIASPLMIFAAIGVKLSSPGPVFYRQERIGWNGARFLILKFRTMPVDMESGGVIWGAKDKEPTKFGRFLRRTSIDELPQFINVLRGEMSIVGPRPERPVFVDKFKDEVPGYMQKHLVKAGITGWAQVNGWRGDTDLSKRIEYDLFYIEHWSLWFDTKIIILTVFRGIWDKNAY